MDLNVNAIKQTNNSVNRDLNPPKSGKSNQQAKSNENSQKANEQVESYTPHEQVSNQANKKVTYDKPQTDQSTIAQLKEASEQAHSNLKRMVEELLRKQGMTFQDALAGKEFKVDEATRQEAEALISEGGDLSAEKVSDQIVAFAKAISGGDVSKFDTLKSAIISGFDEAKAILGGTLPEVSERTYELVMQKLDAWKNGEE